MLFADTIQGLKKQVFDYDCQENTTKEQYALPPPRSRSEFQTYLWQYHFFIGWMQRQTRTVSRGTFATHRHPSFEWVRTRSTRIVAWRFRSSRQAWSVMTSLVEQSTGVRSMIDSSWEHTGLMELRSQRVRTDSRTNTPWCSCLQCCRVVFGGQSKI